MMLPKINTVVSKPNYLLELQFDDGCWKKFSVRPYLKYTVYKPLENKIFFHTVSVKYNTIVRGKENEIDFDSYTVYTEGV